MGGKTSEAFADGIKEIQAIDNLINMNPSESAYDQPEEYLDPIKSGDRIGIHIKSFGHDQREAKQTRSALGPNLDFEGLGQIGSHFVLVTENDEEEAKYNQY